VKNTIN